MPPQVTRPPLLSGRTLNCQKSISFTKRLSDELSASVRNLAIATTSDIIAYRRGGSHVAVGYVFQTAVVVGEGACSQRLENINASTGHEPD
jgi:hypothetical protein